MAVVAVAQNLQEQTIARDKSDPLASMRHTEPPLGPKLPAISTFMEREERQIPLTLVSACALGKSKAGAHELTGAQNPRPRARQCAVSRSVS